MSIGSKNVSHATSSATLADVLERVLDQGIVIAGDIKVKLVEIELLTIQIRLVVCSVEKAIEMGMDWWMTNPSLSSRATAPAVAARVGAAPAIAAGHGAALPGMSGMSGMSAMPGMSDSRTLAPMDELARADRIARLEAELATLRAD